MRKIMQIIIIFCLTVSGLLAISAFSWAAVRVTVTADYANVRSGPDTATAVVTGVHKGESYTALEQKGDWYKISVGGKEGWVAGWLTKAQVIEDTKVAVVQSSLINVRSGPGPNHSVIAQFSTGTKLNILGTEGDWVQVKLPNGSKGWVANWLVKIQGTSQTASTSASSTQATTQTTNNTKSNTAVQQTIKTATVTSEQINVRSGPGTSYNIVAALYKGQQFTVQATDGQWIKINLPNGKTGWLSSAYLTITSTSTATTVSVEQNKTDTKTTKTTNNSTQLVINNNSVNVRGGPGTQHNVVGQVSRGQSLAVLEKSGEWYKVSLSNGSSGWVAGWLVEVQKTEGISEDTVSKQNTSSGNRLEKIEITQNAKHTLVTIKAADTINYSLLQLSDPKRLVVDIKNVGIGDLPGETAVNTELVSQMRVGLFSTEPQVVRLVFDLNSTAICEESISTDRKQLVLDIHTPQLGKYLSGHTIVVDPGHGGSDPGAMGINGLQEKDVTLDIALKLAQLLRENGAKVILTRSSDIFVDLYERAEIAKQNSAEIFLSIHINANIKSSKNGTSTYYRLDTGGVEGVSQSENKRLASLVQAELLENLGRQDIGVLQANFVVLKSSPIPAALAEIAFISNIEEEKALQQESFRARTAEALAIALNNYFAP